MQHWLARSSCWHRAGTIADLAPTEAETKKDQSCGCRLESDVLSHEFFGTVQFVLEFARSLGTERSA